MSRPKKQTIDYFPHNCTHGKTMFILEQKYGNDGYAFWFKLLELLGNAEGHFLHLENGLDWEFLIAVTHLDKDKCKEILNLLADLNAIDKELWLEKSVIWIQKFVDNIKDAYRNRVVEIPQKPSFLRKKPHNNKDNLRQKTANEMKVNEIKEENVENNTFNDDSVEVKLSKILFGKIKQRDPKAKEPDYQKWAVHIDYLNRLDGRSLKDVNEVILWCQRDSFWRNNILSTRKLRDKFTQLYLSMNNKEPDKPRKRYEEVV